MSWRALTLGVALTAVAVPARIASVWLQRRIIHGETRTASLKVAVAPMPTLISTLVLAAILR